MPRRTAVEAIGVLTLVAAAVLAGCVTTQTLGGGATEPERVHDADRPAFLEDGAVEDLDELFATTEPVLADRSYRLRITDVTLVPDAEGRYRDGRLVLVERRRDADGAVMLRQEVTDATGATVTTWNATTYRAAADGAVWQRVNGSTVRRLDGDAPRATSGDDGPDGDRSDAGPTPGGRPVAVDAAPARAPGLLDAPATALVPHRDDTRVVTVTSIEREREIDAGDAFRVGLDVLANRTTQYEGSALVGSDGAVYVFNLDEGGATGGELGDRSLGWSVGDVGATTVDRPDWVPGDGTAAASDDATVGTTPAE